MLARLIARLLFRAGLSLGLLLGVASYGHHLSGGDPGALWAKVAGGALDGVTGSLAGARDAIGGTVADSGAAIRGGGAREGDDRVWTWRDENGVTHYATSRPVDVEARSVTVDPDVNVLAPFAVPIADPAPRAATRSAVGTATGDGERTPMPGIAGALSRARTDAPAPDPAKAEAVLRMLRSSR